MSKVARAAIAMQMGCAAQAQETETHSQRSAQEGVLAEVLVTTQKRDESLQDVPSSIAVVTGKTLEENNSREFEELRYLMPGLDMQERSPATATIDLRGFQNVASHLRVEPVVEVSSETDAPTWSAQVSYDLLEATMAYASYQRSYRPPGRLASRMRTFDPSVLTYPEETGDSIEVGMKATWWGGACRAI